MTVKGIMKYLPGSMKNLSRELLHISVSSVQGELLLPKRNILTTGVSNLEGIVFSCAFILLAVLVLAQGKSTVRRLGTLL